MQGLSQHMAMPAEHMTMYQSTPEGLALPMLSIPGSETDMECPRHHTRNLALASAHVF